MQVRYNLFVKSLSFCFMLVFLLALYGGILICVDMVGGKEVYRERYQDTRPYHETINAYALKVSELYHLERQLEDATGPLALPDTGEAVEPDYVKELKLKLFLPAGSSLAWALIDIDGRVALSNVRDDHTGSVDEVKELTGGIFNQISLDVGMLVIGLRADATGGLAEQLRTFNLMKQWLVVAVLSTVICGVLFIMLFSFLVAVTGYKQGARAISLTPFDRIFTELVLGGLVACVVAFVYQMTARDGKHAVTVCGGLLIGFVVLLFLLVRKIKAGMMYETSLLNPITRFIRQIGRHIDFMGRFIGLVMTYGLIQFFSFYAAVYHPAFFYVSMGLFILFLAFLCIFAVQFDHIWRASERMAGGDFGEIIDEKAVWMFRKVARNINSASRAMSTAVENTMSSERLKTQLITNVSHDLKTPLTSIISYVGLLRATGIDDPRAREYIDILDRKSRRLGQLMADLVDIAKVSSGNIAVNRETMNLSELLGQAVGEFDSRAADRNIRFVQNLPERPAHIYADGRHMWRVLDNLLGNATKYAMESTRVYIDVLEQEETVRLCIKNVSSEPLNIPAEELMERFVRGDRARNTEGSGLGLSIAGSLMEIQDGRMDLSIDGDMFKVCLTIPRKPPPEEAAPVPAETGEE